MDAVDIEEVRLKFDREAGYRKIGGLFTWVVSAIAVAFSLFHLYTAALGVLPAQLQRSIHLGFALVLVFLLYPGRHSGRDRLAVSDVILAGLSVVITGYVAVNLTALFYRAGNYTTLDMVIGGLAILLVLEAARRVVGLPIVMVASAFMLYCYFGPHMPGFLQHRGASLHRIISHMYYTTEGIMGIPLGVSSTFIFLFILFGAFLERTGIGRLFIDIANAIAGGAAGGPAKVAVITSAFEGTVSGSSVANTVGSGSLTIPMMKSLGYRPEFAGAVEASASTGGQIMPPIMGAAAFLMAEFIGIPYLQVAKSAVIPAILYFTGVFIVVHLEAKKSGLRGLTKEEIPRLSTIIRERGHLIIPLIGIIYFLVEGATPTKAAFYGILLALAVSALSPRTRMTPRDILAALEQGARNALAVALACATAGIIVGTVTLTGLGLKLANGLLELAGGHLLPTLAFTMLTSLILGMGAPTTANYVITSTIAAPALVKLGIPVLAAHMFTFYFGIVADVTPPVALAAMAGAGIAGANPLKTGIEATKLSIAAFLVPYFFAYSPSLLLINVTIPGIIRVTAGAILGMLGIGAALEGWLVTAASWPERIAFLVGGLLLIDPGLYTDLLGGAILLLTYLLHRMRARGIHTRGIHTA
ncbi:MAG TPA: TRAP transporter permease [Firmicutes bacterium]|nr:TRAP transporter permease [Bacillota bacterium]